MEVIVKDNSSQPNDKLITDLESYLNFVNLCKKPRPPEVKSIIEKIVKSETSIVNRIKRINEIDDKLKYDPKSFKNNNNNPSIKAFPQLKIVQNNLFNYILFQRSKLISFGTRTKTIDFRFFGLKKELSASAIVFWKQCYNEVKDHLYKQLNYIVLYGWKDLDPLSYNLMAKLNDFIVKFVKEGELLDRNLPLEQNFKIIESIMESYLLLTLLPSYKDLIKESIFQILMTHKDFKSTNRDSMRILEELINYEKRTLGFFNILLAFFSLNYNRFVIHEDLLKHFQFQQIDSDKFIFNEKTLSEINSYMQSINEELNKIENDLFRLKFIDPNLSETSQPENKWVELYNRLCFYELYSSQNTRGSFKEDVYDKNPFQSLFKDVLRYLVRVTQGFINTYGPILKNEIEITKDHHTTKVKIFNPVLFRKEFQTFEEVLKDYDFIKSQSEVITITFDTYNQYNFTKKISIEKEEKLCKLIERLLDTYKIISINLTNLLLGHSIASISNPNQLLDKYKEQNKIIDSIDEEENRLIPYAFEIIVHNKFLGEIRVIDLLNQIVFFVKNLIFLFRENEIHNRYLEKDKLIEKMESILTLKSKITI